MWDEDFLNFFNGTTTTTDTDTQTNQSNFSAGQNQTSYGTEQETYSPYSTNQNYSTDYNDDYSVTPNYKEETNYNSSNLASSNETEAEQETKQETRYRKMVVPTIEKRQEAVSLTKTREKVYLGSRMKIAISMFSIIMFSLVFVICWNFLSLSRINSEIADKQAVINELTQSISSLEAEYNLVSRDERLIQAAIDEGYVYADETNTYQVSSGTFYTEESVEELPSNWFNDVCEFLSNLFN